MEVKCVNPCSKRKSKLLEKSERYNLRKRMKALEDSSVKDWTIIAPDEQRKIYHKKGEKNVFDQKESESSEEEEGITVEELKKTQGWKILMEALDPKIEKNKSSTK